MIIPTFLTILLMLCCVAARGTTQQQGKEKKQHKIYISGKVKDSFTMVDLKAFVTVMNADSTVIDTVTANGWRTDINYGMQIPARTGKYIIKAQCDGYETGYIDYDIKYIARNKSFGIPYLPLRKKISREVELDGVTVTSTKVKFVYRGDTIVYNASAFNVPDGSMLDAIVRQLPGAEIKSNGDIYVNGKKIDFLLLNGKDFFKGDNKIMLDNLPYYTVKDLKVYNRSSEKSRLMGKEVEKKDYVMDVGLKREYNRSYVANAEAAGGTKERYLARLFGLYYTDHARVSVFGNLNNVNENRRPGYNGDWSPANSPQGQKTTRQAGVSLNLESKDGKLKDEGEATLKLDDLDDVSRTATESFASAGNIFSRSTSDLSTKSHAIGINNNLSRQGTTGFIMSTNLSYSNNRTAQTSRSATYTADPTGYGGIRQTLDSTFAQNIRGSLHDILTNRSMTRSQSKTKSLTVDNFFNSWFRLPWGDRIELNTRVSYTSIKPGDAFSLSRNEYIRAEAADLRNLYADTHSRSYKYGAGIMYALEIPNTPLTVKAGPQYQQTFKSQNNMNYRLERLGGQWADNPMATLGTLPDDKLLDDALDTKTSRRYSDLLRQTGAVVSLVLGKPGLYIDASLEAFRENESMRYHTATADTTATRRRTKLRPSVFIQKYSDKLFVYMQYYVMNDMADFASLMPYTDDTNPLAIRVNNPRLKNPTTHHYDIRINRSGMKHQQSLGFFATGNFYRNLAGTRAMYNKQTGAYTYTSDNVRGGNWDFWTTLSYNTAIGKKRVFWFDTSLWLNGLKRTDFDIAYDNGDTKLYNALTTELGTNTNLRYQKGSLTMAIGGKVEWRHGTSNRDNFDNTSAFDFQYGGSITCRLPLGLSLSTDIKEYCRRGYSEKSINTSDLVWNASLARSFCKGTVTLKAEAFDILHQLTNAKYALRAQTRTETWLNTIPSYAMMHLSYRFNKTPKKK